MQLGRVIGTVVATVKSPGLEGVKFLVVQPLDRQLRPVGGQVVAADAVHMAGPGELVYIVADERDLIRLRTNYRHDPPEDVYIYRTRGPIEVGRRLFLEYMRRINALTTQPEFYNTLTTNCTTNIWTNTHVNPGRVPLSWKILASGYVPEYLYEQGRLETMGSSFPELRERAHVNARAQAADKAADFSRRIRM